MATFLLTWNPKITTVRELPQIALETAKGQRIPGDWSCGKTKKIQVGDRLFLLKQRVETRGIFGSAYASSPSYPGPHWDETRRKKGEMTQYVDLEFDRVLNVDPDAHPDEIQQALPMSQLPRECQRVQMSGTQIPDDVADKLESLWNEHLRKYDSAEATASEHGAVEGEIRIAMRRHHARERRLRDAKLREAKALGAGSIRCEVSGCGFDFFEVYGKIGEDFAHVHHLTGLADRSKPSETKLKDLAVVCAN
jgi:5-methylcytosine-specific restriction enzyme A